MLTYNQLITLKNQLVNQEISFSKAQEVFWDGHDKHKRSWQTKDWKERRALIIKDACEDCGSKERITLQHLEHPLPYYQYSNRVETEYTKQYIEREMPIDIGHFVRYIMDEYNYTPAPMCPHCNGRYPNERMRKLPKYLCTACKSEFESCVYYSIDDIVRAYFDGEESAAIADKCFSKKTDTKVKHHVKDIKYWYQRSIITEQEREAIEREAFLLFVYAQIAYLSFEKTKTNCNRCAFEYDKLGRNLCLKCKTNYKGIIYATCVDCLPEDKKADVISKRDFAAKMYERSKELGID